jgi:hypothetical protein
MFASDRASSLMHYSSKAGTVASAAANARQQFLLLYEAMGRGAIVFPQTTAPSRRRVIQEGPVAWSLGKGDALRKLRL